MHKNVTTIVVIDNPRPTMSRSAYDRAVHVIPGLVGEFSATLRYSPYTLFCALASNTTPSAHLVISIGTVNSKLDSDLRSKNSRPRGRGRTASVKQR